jgi:hypothetical protein
MANLLKLFLAVLASLFKSRARLEAENLVLRQQVNVLRRRMVCLSKVILFGERSLRRVLSDYLDHFHAKWNHQGKGNVLLFPRVTDRQREGPVRCRERLGGLLRYYHREAA